MTNEAKRNEDTVEPLVRPHKESLAAFIDRTQPMDCCGRLAKDCNCWKLPGIDYQFPQFPADEPNAVLTVSGGREKTNGQ